MTLKSPQKNLFLLLALCLFFLPSQSFAAVFRPIVVEFSFSGEASSYRLYQDGVFLCESFNVSLKQMNCGALFDAQPVSFTMTAVTVDGETPPSVAYIVTPPEQDGFGNYLPTASVTTDITSGELPLDVHFDASSSTDFDGQIVLFHWDFGDGYVQDGKIIDHTFFLPGIYTVTLTVIDNSGAIGSTQITIETHLPPPPPQICLYSCHVH